MDNIILPTENFDFSELKLLLPSPMQQYFFSKISYKNNPLYIKCPKCSTKQGLIKGHKKINTDLMFEIIESELMGWIERLEEMCIQIINTQSSVWFEEPLEKVDIENAFIPTLKMYKSGKFYLIHVNIKPTLKVYNEEHNVLTLEDINNNSLLSIIEIQGIKFNNKNFQIEMELKQCMIIQPDPFLENCFFSKDTIKHNKKLVFDKDTEEIQENKLIKPLEEPLTTKVEEPLEEKQEEQEEEEEKQEEQEEQEDQYQEEEDQYQEDLEEVDLDTILNEEPINLKPPDEVYWNMYKKTLDKAKELKQQAIESYLNAKNIKELYNLKDNDFDEDLDELNKF